MKNIEIKRWDNNEVIHAGEYESIADCFNAGKAEGKSFHRANLSEADLYGANLYGADLSEANLSRADLREADLSKIKSFNHVVGDGKVINSMQFGEYKIAIMGNVCCGGCTTKTCQEWLDFDGSGLTGSDAMYLEGITKPYIRMILAMRDMMATS